MTVEFSEEARPLVRVQPERELANRGHLIINADDWGRNRETTDRIQECVLHGTVSSVSAMAFMEDSERAADQAREGHIDAGLHLNLTTPFSASDCHRELRDRQQELASCLQRWRLSQAIFYPHLMRTFEYVVSVQIEEFARLYGAPPARVDGHHHMHLCSNVLLGKLLPEGTVVRRNFSFRPGEKGPFNRAYRAIVDKMLARRHGLTDYFFSLAPLEPRARLEWIFSLANEFMIEVETHPVCREEYDFLTGEEILRSTAHTRIAPSSAILRAKTELAS